MVSQQGFARSDLLRPGGDRVGSRLSGQEGKANKFAAWDRIVDCGGGYWKKDGKVLLRKQHGAEWVSFPRSVMILWPHDSKLAEFPVTPELDGIWIRFGGTPYAHLIFRR